MKKRLLLTFAFVCLVGLYTSAQDYITVYEDCGYRGNSHRLYEGDHLDRDLGVGNDKISAIRIPRGWEVTVYTDNNYRGQSRTFDEDVNCMPADLNDKISSIRVTRRSYSRPGSGSSGGPITLYADCGFRGSRYSIGLGTYTANELGIGNDRLSSLRIPEGYRVTLYVDNNKRGFSKEFRYDVECLTSEGLNDRVSSINVSRANNWQSSQSNKKAYRPSGGSSGDVVLYRDCNYRGTSLRLGEGVYYARDLNPIGNDRLSSLRIPKGYTVTLYMDNELRGQRAVFTVDISCLPSVFNDKTSSIEIKRSY